MARVGTFDRAGSIALRDGNEELARALWEYRCSLLQPQPRKHYVVMWSDAPILGPDSWKGLRVGETLMDRQYRRALSFIKTDISTGDRGVPEADVRQVGTCKLSFAVVADAWGLHFRFTERNESAVNLGRGEGLKDGSFEMYIAPHAGAQHSCLLWSVGPDLFCKVWNCAYDHAGYLRIREGRLIWNPCRGRM